MPVLILIDITSFIFFSYVFLFAFYPLKPFVLNIQCKVGIPTGATKVYSSNKFPLHSCPLALNSLLWRDSTVASFACVSKEIVHK